MSMMYKLFTEQPVSEREMQGAMTMIALTVATPLEEKVQFPGPEVSSKAAAARQAHPAKGTHARTQNVRAGPDEHRQIMERRGASRAQQAAHRHGDAQQSE